ncbi:MAG: HEAT repeat domain-containing protein [Acidobacteria bacterium]|nr:HEAT repeat domain-containing protein [Acidobacteriota bacterium]
MPEKIDVKAAGLAFGQSLQRAFKIAVLYSPQHVAAEKPLQQTYDCLNTLLKQTKQFTLGFLNHRVLLNNVLTSDNSLAALDAEFSKRGIGALSFSPGITFGEFKRGVALLATKPDVIERQGGIRSLAKKNPIEGMQVLAAEKKGTKDEDTILEMDSQPYLAAQVMLEAPFRGGMPSLELLLQSVGMEKPAGFAASPGGVLDLAGKATQAIWADPGRDPQEASQKLALLLEELTPEYLISALPASRQSQLRGRASQEIASEMAEDMAVEWATERLSAAPEEEAVKMAVVGEVAQVLGRALKTTLVAERLLRKIADLSEAANLQSEVKDRIRNEVKWFALSTEEKHAYLMGLTEFNDQEFRHLLDYLREAEKKDEIGKAVEAARHYLAFLDAVPRPALREGLVRMPELLRTIIGPQTAEFTQAVVLRLVEHLVNENLQDREYHQQIVNCLTTAAQKAVLYEEFGLVAKVAAALRRSAATDPARHADCCLGALENLLPPARGARLIELYLQRSSQPGQAKELLSLLKLIGPQGGEIVFQCLDAETVTANRLKLVRLIGYLGPSAVEATQKRLNDENWYTVRNACHLVGELGNPELAAQLTPALRHADLRVQQAALTALLKNRVPNLGQVLVEAAPSLPPHLLESALDQLAVLRDPSVVDLAAALFFGENVPRTGTLEKAVRAVAVMPAEPAVKLLGRILADPGQPLSARRTALLTLKSSPVSLAQQVLAAFARDFPQDPLAAECKTPPSPSP